MRRLFAVLAVLLLAAAAATGGWYYLKHRQVLPPGFVAGNGRIEASEIDIATKYAARVQDIAVEEGDLVKAGAVIARMDTRDLEAQLRSAEAQVQQALQYRAQVQAEIAQRRSELDLADKDPQRAPALRPEERRDGKECGNNCRSRV